MAGKGRIDTAISARKSSYDSKSSSKQASLSLVVYLLSQIKRRDHIMTGCNYHHLN
jgi:hypothetical protein